MTRLTGKSGRGPEIDRRSFLGSTAGFTFVVTSSGLLAACSGADMGRGSAEVTPNIWVRIASDGIITVTCPPTEMGQGTQTTLPAVLAEELDADWSNIRVEGVGYHDPALGNPIFGNILHTAGSASIEGYYDRMRLAGAHARKILIHAVADFWGAPADELVTDNGRVIDPVISKVISYGDIVGSLPMPDPLPQASEADFKRREDYRFIGKDLPRLDIPSKSNGSAIFGIDVQVDGMVYGTVLRPPVEGETPVRIDDAVARQVAGFIDIQTLPTGVGVVAESIDAAFRVREALNVTWTSDSEARGFDTEADIRHYTEAVRDEAQAVVIWRENGDTKAALAEASQVFQAEYQSDYAYHAQMEPMNATASVAQDGSVEVWTSTQSPSIAMFSLMEETGLPQDQITLHPMLIGGGYGRRSTFQHEWAREAIQLSRAVARPVKVIWTREDDLKNGWFRPLAVQRMEAALDENGRIAAWRHRVATPSVLEYFNPPRWEQAKPRDVISMNGAESREYVADNFLAEHVMTRRGGRIAPWRGVGTSYTRFATESFIDEIAAASGQDPVAMRLDLTRDDPRAHAVVRRVAEMADWGRAREGTALGIALSGYKNSKAAGIAEISLDEATGVIRVHNYWLAADAGLILSPVNTEAQLFGNVIFGLSNALKEVIIIQNGEIRESNFHDYELMRINEVPEIHTEIIHTDAPPTGVGELGLATTGPALANALAALTGKRLRRLPLLPERVLEVLSA